MDVRYGSFIWDAEKEGANLQKHGVDFTTATRVFADSNRKIFKDSAHSLTEDRFYCLGRIESRILTVRFTYRENQIRIIGAGYWRQGRRYYEEA